MSDPHNCGACGHDCLGGTCTSGVCSATPLAGGVAKTGGQPFVVATLLAVDAGTQSGLSIVLDQGTLYWSVGTNDLLAAGAAFASAPAAARGATPTEIWASSPNNPWDTPIGIAFAGGFLYAAYGCNSIYEMPVPPGAPPTSVYSYGCSVDPADYAFALDQPNGYAYLLDRSNFVNRISLSSGMPAPSIPLPGTTPLGMALTGGTLYVLGAAADGGATLQASAPDGGSARDVAQALAGNATNLVVDATAADFATITNPSATLEQRVFAVVRTDLQTGVSVPIFMSPAGSWVTALITDDAYAYVAYGYSTLATSEIVRVPK